MHIGSGVFHFFAGFPAVVVLFVLTFVVLASGAILPLPVALGRPLGAPQLARLVVA